MEKNKFDSSSSFLSFYMPVALLLHASVINVSIREKLDIMDRHQILKLSKSK